MRCLTLVTIFQFATLATADAQIPKTAADFKWDITTAPFDVKKLLAVPPQDQNGAELTLEALTEFSTEAIPLLPKNLQADRHKQVKTREETYLNVSNLIDSQGDKVDRKIVDELVAMHADGFRKMARAQRKPHTVFETPIGVSVVLRNIHGARAYARISELKCVRQLERGEIDAALDTLQSLLTLSQSLEPRSGLISQLVGHAIHNLACVKMVNRVLAAPKLTPAHCTRLIKLLRQSVAAVERSGETGMQIEYLSIRTIIDDIQYRRGEFSPKFLKEELKIQNANTYEEMVAHVLGNPDKALAKKIAAMKAADFEREVKVLNRVWSDIDTAVALPYPLRQELLAHISTVDGDGNSAIILKALWPVFDGYYDAQTRTLARLNGYLTLAAVRRWQLTSTKPLPADLQKIAEAAGLKSVPQDPYTDGKPIKLLVKNGKALTYSIGSDGEDQKATVESKHGRKTGDVIYRIPDNVHFQAEK